MTDKVQKIREEVVRMHNLLPVMDGDNISVNYADKICTTLEMYIDSLQKEPVSEDLEKAIDTYLATYFGGEKEKQNWPFLKKMAIHFAKWQKAQDQKTIELAEDHAMLAGMEKMKKEMMEKAVETTFNVSLPSGLYDKLWIKGCKDGDKLLVIKKDEL